MSASSIRNPMRQIRTDIQALRTVAVSMVVLFHLWPNRMPGGFIGVDVFFVISGFLITKHILQEVELGHFSVTGFWARRIKRLLPASFLVLFTTGIGIVLLAPVSSWSQWLGEVQAAVFYFENWNLAGAAVDYLALANEASPVQHFWSLSTEEQFYFVWPLLVALATYLAAKTQVLKPRNAILATMILVVACSLTFGIFYTSAQPAIAYFSTPVRAWEFGAGALLVFLPEVKSKTSKAILGSAGLALVFVAAFVIDTKTPFPGSAALLPVVGTAAVIVAAVKQGWLAKMLSMSPVQWVGDKSYAIYLWHWPVLILTPLLLKSETTIGIKIALLSITLVLAGLTHKFVETPIASIRPAKWKIFAIAATTSIFLASLCGLGIQLGNQQISDQLKFGKLGVISTEKCFGAAARADINRTCVNENLSGVYPSLAVASSDSPELPESCFSVSREQVAASFCPLGDRTSTVKIAAVGDSHIAQYAGALNALAIKNNWAIDMYAKGGCPFSYAVRVHDAVLTKNCPLWVANVVEKLSSSDYNLMVTSQRAGVAWVGGKESAVSGLTSIWQEMTSAGLPILALKDSPQPDRKMPACLLTGNKCLLPKVSALGLDPQVNSALQVPEVRLADFDYFFCDEKNCFPVIGNVVVYRDDNHITDTFARTLAPYIEKYIVQAISK